MSENQKIDGIVIMGGNSGETVGNRNLSPWVPGQSGNPNGRPMGAKTGLRARLIQGLDKAAPNDIVKVLEAKGIKLDQADNAEVISFILIWQASKGNVQAAKLISEQTELPHPKELNLAGDFYIKMPQIAADCL